VEALSAPLGPARVVWTGRAQGHLGLPGAADTDLEARRRAVVDQPWHWLRQVHGSGVLDADAWERDSVGDGLVSTTSGVALAVFTADCAPLAMASEEGVIGLAHAGWRGVLAGIVEATAEAMRARGATAISAILGPCIRAGCYEFGPAELDAVAAAYGDGVRARTTWGAPALDLAGAVGRAAEAAGVTLRADVGACTACSTAWFSHRARGDVSRQATVIWMPA
jgi:YfiH family protein